MFSKHSTKVNHPSHILHVVLSVKLPSIEPRVLNAAMQLLSFDKRINKTRTLILVPNSYSEVQNHL